MLAQREEHADAITGAADKEAVNQGILQTLLPLPTHPQDGLTCGEGTEDSCPGNRKPNEQPTKTGF